MMYGIKFTGPNRRDIWWNEDGPYGSKILTFSNINDAYEWSALRKSLWPHCEYKVVEMPKDVEQVKKKKKQLSWEEKFWQRVSPY